MKKITIVTLCFTAVGCAQLQSDFRDAAIAADASAAAGGENCRTYPTGYNTGGNTYTCTWNGGSLQFVCSGPSNVQTLQYPSLKKFIEEPKIVARFFFTSSTISGSGASTSTFSYDGSDRLVGISIAASGITSLTYAYSTFDGNGRPISGLYNLSAAGFTCVNANVTRNYNDSARTMTESISGGTGILCTASSSTSTYDAETGLDVSIVASPGGTFTKSITGRNRICE